MEMIILGAGIAGLSLAKFLTTKSLILERDEQVGGLCRSFDLNGISHDIGPHIMFSKNKEILSILTSFTQTSMLRRSNKILYKGRFVKYPFENELSALDPHERDYCLQEFLNNPYEEYVPQNMMQFFLKTFGEGITKSYLQPYNDKIWKFDTACMDTQMVERIPKPLREDIIKSAQGVSTEGYTHQLNFYYPTQGGFQAVIDNLLLQLEGKSTIFPGTEIKKIQKLDGVWNIQTNKGLFSSRSLINCMPLHELFKYLQDIPDIVLNAFHKLKFNSIYIVNVQVKKDALGDNFAFYIPDQDIIFHRLSKLNFLGQAYCLPNGASTLMAEITFRPGSYLAQLSEQSIKAKVLEGLVRLKLIQEEDVLCIDSKKFHYAYVIYDLDHRKNVDLILEYLKLQGVYSCGRFAEFEYLNTDGVLERSLALAQKLNELSNNKNIEISL